ncbi:MAG: hypothetical protein KAH56_00530, partial [Candidatus Krumholzibacteria bacterium]|nr:hypothetical protein [Candidatus Krumholzibacteria bacterium]
MNFAKVVRIIPGVFVLLALLIQSCPAQTSIGFENPGDTTNLLEYRLPDWGYRTWDLGFALSGAGADDYYGDSNYNISNRFSTQLSSGLVLYRESETRTRSLFADVGGSYGRSHYGNETHERSGHNLDGDLAASGKWQEFLGEGPVSVLASGGVNWNYTESIQESQGLGQVDESRRFTRRHIYSMSLGAGLGRVRDVTPLIRAQRLSERLKALGRTVLTPYQIQQVASVLAQEQGYRSVFDRPSRSFWRDVLEPMLDQDNPLSPYEIFYLADVMSEDVGPRKQGTELQGRFFYHEYGSDDDFRSYGRISRGPAVFFLWTRNLNLDNQLSLRASARYATVGGQEYKEELVSGGMDLAHLWTIADRYRLDTSLNVAGYYNEQNFDAERAINRSIETTLHSIFRIFLEDSMALSASVLGSSRQSGHDSISYVYADRYSRSWHWSYGIG